MQRWWLALLLALTCSSCGRIEYPSIEAATGGSSGAPHGTGGAGTGGSVSTDGSSGGKSCIRTADHFSATFVTSGGVEPPKCPSGGTFTTLPQMWHATGNVVGSGTNTMKIDQCSPAADCAPMLTDVSWEARDLALVVPVGAIVEVDWVVEVELVTQSGTLECIQTLSIENIPSWGPTVNSVSTKPEFYLAAAEGTHQTPYDIPVTQLYITPQALGCQPPSKSCDGTSLVPDDYQLVIGVPDVAEMAVGMGDTIALGEDYTAANLRSYESSVCDGHRNWAYWVAKQ